MELIASGQASVSSKENKGKSESGAAEEASVTVRGCGCVDIVCYSNMRVDVCGRVFRYWCAAALAMLRRLLLCSCAVGARCAGAREGAGSCRAAAPWMHCVRVLGRAQAAAVQLRSGCMARGCRGGQRPAACVSVRCPFWFSCSIWLATRLELAPGLCPTLRTAFVF
eukprot:352231-Chlamydomonas_euryale.AAC.8